MTTLHALTRAGDAPFRMMLTAGGELQCQEIVRRVPGRRLVCRADWNGRRVYAKLFVGAKAERDAVCDATGARALMAAGLPTPELLLESGLAEGGRALLYAEVEHAIDAERQQALLGADDDQRHRLALRLVEVVAGHHRAGLLQRDMYLKNFLVTQEAIFSLDGDGIRVQAAQVAVRPALDNLALLLSKFDAEDDAWLPEMLGHYQRVLGREIPSAMAHAFPRRVMAQRMRVARKYADKKVFRNCSDVQVERSATSFLAVRRAERRAALDEFLRHPEQGAGGAMLKDGNTCTVFMLDLGGLKVVVKRYNIKGFWHGLSRAPRPTRAAVSWANAHRLAMLGVRTVAPLALLERRWGPLRREAYFVAGFDEAPDALAYFADASIPDAARKRAARNVARMLRKLFMLGLVHGDMKATNVLISAAEQPVLLDLDALHEVKWPARPGRGHVRDLRRWMRNWQHDADTTALMSEALKEIYRDDPVLGKAGIVVEQSEKK